MARLEKEREAAELTQSDLPFPAQPPLHYRGAHSAHGAGGDGGDGGGGGVIKSGQGGAAGDTQLLY